MELTLIRHPPIALPAHVCVGSLDAECASGWEAHADRLQALLQPAPRLYSSPLARCRVLAARLGVAWDVVACLDPRLQELHFGSWEGRSWHDIDRAESDPWAEDPLRVAPPAGESYANLLLRVDAFLAEIVARDEAATIVTHAGPLRAILVRLLGLDPTSAWSFDVAHARATRVRRASGAWRLHTLNA